MFPLTIEESQSNHKRKVCYIDAKKLVLMIKKLEIIVIIMENTEELLIMPGTLTVKDQNKFMWYFIMVLHTTIILLPLIPLAEQFKGEFIC